MAKTKVTDIRYEVSGYFAHHYIEHPIVRVVVSGTYEGHNLKGACLVDLKHVKSSWRRPVETRGIGRYSFMVGGSSLRNGDPAYAVICTGAKLMAEDWQAMHPKALHEFLIEQARLNVEKYHHQSLQAKTEMDNADEAWRKAIAVLNELEGQD
jgi:hypothetical protein